MAGEQGAPSAAAVVVAARAAAREVPRAAAAWALAHVARPGDAVLILVLMPPPQPAAASGRRPWSFPFFAGGCASAHAAAPAQRSDVSDLCAQMTLTLRDLYDPSKVDLRVRIVAGAGPGTVAAEARRARASWVVLDRDLKVEETRCMEELQCNIVAVRRSRPKVLRLNLACSTEEAHPEPATPPPQPEPSAQDEVNEGTVSDPATSPMFASETDISSPETEAFDDSTGASSAASSEPGTTTPACASERDMSPLKRETVNVLSDPGSEASAATPQAASAAASPSIQPWMADILQRPGASPRPTPTRRRTPTADALLEKIAKLDLLTEISAVRSRSDLNFRGNVRDVVSLSRTPAPGPPPLCSVCQHKTPVFGKPPRWFSYAELEHATGGFSRANFLAEGGFGSVHRGVLPDGQAIAVKQHRLASSSQGDVEFCSEVEVLSCAQHRNVVMLIGFCVEGKRRLLVYEYICNRSLDTHLYGRHKETLGWAARQKIAVGAARGLRYLHEECRVGCIIHRDMRPNNILVTHDFEPLVGDFGLARWQPDGDMGVDTRVIGTFGYLAPEYAQSGQITEKADVYSFGVVLVELVTGRKAVDINRPKGQQFLTEWARPLLEEHAIDDLIDPRLEDRFCENEVYCMLHAANLCIRRDPHSRPRMSHVLRILEGDMVVESGGCISAPSSDAGSMSRRMLSDRLHYQEQGSPVRSDQRVSAVNRSLETTLRSAWDADEQGLSNRFWYPSAAAADCSQHPR
uniref:Protein kinase domain-containing protein n=1 Tax=Triticum urartu TaxID=4572 RepID=A0A8R7P8D4_TRIUA